MEVVPDFRFTVTPTRVEYRPGIGVTYKNLFTKSQLVHQVKWQYDQSTCDFERSVIGEVDVVESKRYAFYEVPPVFSNDRVQLTMNVANSEYVRPLEVHFFSQWRMQGGGSDE